MKSSNLRNIAKNVLELEILALKKLKKSQLIQMVSTNF